MNLFFFHCWSRQHRPRGVLRLRTAARSLAPPRVFRPLMIRVLLAILFLPALSAPLFASLRDCFEATCRITSGPSCGSGCVFDRSDGYLYVLTNAHVVTRSDTVRCEFWRDGRQSSPVLARVVFRDERADVAVVAVPESVFGGRLPKVIPLSDPATRPESGEPVFSVGCALGNWPTAWIGRLLSASPEETRFLPPPANGRSGSAVFDAEGTRIVGLIFGRDETHGQGLAVPLDAIRASLHTPGRIVRTQACPDGLCPLPQTGLFCSPPRNDGWRASPETPAWPGYPPQPSINLDSTNQKLDEIARLLREMRAADTPRQEVQPEVELRLNQAEETAQAAQSRSERLEQGLNLVQGALSKITGDFDTLPERIRERLEKVRTEGDEDMTTRETLRAYVKDYASEKLSDGTLGLTTGKLLGGALGLSGPLALGFGAAGWFISRRLGKKVDGDESLLVSRLIERLSDRIETLRQDVRQSSGGKA